jgi:hypothetical protein
MMAIDKSAHKLREEMVEALWGVLSLDPDYDVDPHVRAAIAQPELEFFLTSRKTMRAAFEAYKRDYPDRELDGNTAQTLAELQLAHASLQFIEANEDVATDAIRRAERRLGRSLDDEELDQVLQAAFLLHLKQE